MTIAAPCRGHPLDITSKWRRQHPAQRSRRRTRLQHLGAGAGRTQPSRADRAWVPLAPSRAHRPLTTCPPPQREASAESNDETTSGLEDDTASLTAASIAPSLSSRDSFETTSIPSFSPPGGKKGKRHPSAALPAHISAPARETDGEGEYSEGSAGRE